ncbi:asparagine synthetase B family protein, partial [Chryseobacterium sp. Alg-005]|uniref:asparagine synthetase B family protein n=1 Tax=Chryseobacterium sp. Alg-005 TaxID=3159516 RepID=UPI0036F2178C
NKRILMDYLLISLTDHTEETFFKDVNVLRSSHNLILDLATNTIEKKKYYDVTFRKDINQLNLDQSIAKYKEIFDQSVTLRMRSDVKVGTCLSGGLDSSYISAIASEKYNEVASDNFNAITAESLEPRLNETKYAKMVVEHCHLNWNVTSPTKNDFEEYTQALVEVLEEPFGTPSVFLQNRVMKKAKEAGVTVLLDGQGADESLLGYPKYLGAYVKSLPALKKVKFLKNISKNLSLKPLYLMKSHLYFTNFAVRKRRALSRLGKVNQKYLKAIDFTTLKEISKSYNDVFEMQKLEITKTQIPQLLKWEDKNSMAFSIETRLPFLDYRLVEASLSMNNDYKLKDYWSKYILRKSMEDSLPEEIVWRKTKIGFEAPTKDWLKESFIWDLVNKSPLLNDIFDGNITKSDDVAFSWRLCNIALWEKVFNVKF